MANIVEHVKNARMKLTLDAPVKPEWVSAAGVLASIYVVRDPILAVSLALAFDLLDGMIARARKLGSKRGLLSDYACDRYSEYIIFGYLSLTNHRLLLLPAVNTIATYLVLQKKKWAYVLPLRQLLLLYLLYARFF